MLLASGTFTSARSMSIFVPAGNGIVLPGPMSRSGISWPSSFCMVMAGQK